MSEEELTSPEWMPQEPRTQSLGCGAWPLHGGECGHRGLGDRGEVREQGQGVTSRSAQPTTSTYGQWGGGRAGGGAIPITCLLPPGPGFSHPEGTLNPLWP